MAKQHVLSAAAFGVAALACAGSLTAQTTNRIGFTAGFSTTFIDRIGGTTLVGDVLQHFDDRDYQDFMLNPADPTGSTYVFNGVLFTLQDQVTQTPETYDIVAYNEDPANANFPDPAANWFRTGAINYPPMPAGWTTPTGPIAWNITVTFTSPSAPKGSKWIGLGLPQPTTGTWPADGLSPHTTFDRALATTTANSDVPGFGITGLPAANLSCFMQTAAGVPVGAATYPGGAGGGRRQIKIDLLANVTGGVCVTQTNQTNPTTLAALYPASTPGTGNALVPLGGTTNMLSGTNPDVYDLNFATPPRADDIGFLVTNVNFPNAPVFMMRSFGPSPIGSLPVTAFPSIATPTSVGNLCIDFTTAELSLGFSDASGRFQHMEVIPPSIRAIASTFSPLDVWYQAFVVNVAGSGALLDLRATGCGIQHL